MIDLEEDRAVVLTLRVGGSRLELDTETLSCDGAGVPVGPTPVRLLAYLADNRDRVVSAEELLAEVWRGVSVTPSSLQRAVHALRRELGEGLGDALIQTVRGQGYRLGAAVEVEEQADANHELPLVGRESALARMAEAVESARKDRGQLILVGGAPGIGKTRLLQELEVRAPRRGFGFLCGRCPEQRGAAALWPWEEIVRGALHAFPHALDGLAPSDRQTLHAAFPLLGGSGESGAAPLDPGLARFRLYDAVRHLLVSCARERPLMVAIDDLHRGDETSLHLLEWIAARNAGGRVVLVAAHRELPAQLDARFRATLARLLALPATTGVSLARLERQDVERAACAALGRSVSAPEIDALCERSAGNPFFLQTLLRAARLAGSGTALAAGAGEAVQRHIEGVAAATQQVLRHAAVLGREIDAADVAALSEASLEQVTDALAEARAAGLVEAGPHASPRFVHALVVEALRESLEDAARMALHARAVRILEPKAQHDESALGALAEHAWQAAPVLGAGRARALCEQAAQAAQRRFAFEEAARLYERALALASEADAAQRLSLLLALGESHAMGGDVASAVAVLERGIELARQSGDDASLARAVLAIARMREDEIESVEASWIRTLEEATSAQRADVSLRARLLSRLAAAVWAGRALERVRPMIRESVALARQSGDPDALAEVLTRAYRLLQTGLDDDAERTGVAEELSRALEGARDPMLALGARSMLLWEALIRGDRSAYEDQVFRTIEQAAAVGAPHADWHALVARTSRAHLLGQLDQAEQLAEAGLALGEGLGMTFARRTYALQMLCIRWDQGRLAELEPIFAAASANPLHAPVWRYLWSLARLEQGEPGPARELLREYCADPDRLMRDFLYANTLYVLARIAVDTGEADAAAVLAPRLDPLRGRHALTAPSFCHWGSVDTPLGGLYALLERWEESEAALEAGLARDRRFGAIAAVARGQRNLSAMLLRRGRAADRPRAHKLLDEALSLARGIGMADLERACAALAAH